MTISFIQAEPITSTKNATLERQDGENLYSWVKRYLANCGNVQIELAGADFEAAGFSRIVVSVQEEKPLHRVNEWLREQLPHDSVCVVKTYSKTLEKTVYDFVFTSEDQADQFKAAWL